MADNICNMSDPISSLSHEQLVALVIELQKEIQFLKEQLAKATKTSANSSKRPSSDIVKPKKHKRSRKKLKQGAQQGHPKHESPLKLQDADKTVDYRLACCPRTGARLTPMADLEPKVRLQYELVEKPIELTAHLAHPFWCERCRKIHWAELPKPVRKGGIAGARLSAFIAIIKGGSHASTTSTQKILSQLGAPLATGTICKIRNKASAALDAPYTELLEALPNQSFLNIDETGHKDQGDQFWNWCFVTEAFTLFRLAEKRSSAVLTDVLGTKCAATLGSDFYGAYRKYIKQAPVTIQFCMAHLIRELKFIAESTTQTIANYGKRLLDLLKKIFQLIHRREDLGEERFQKKMRKLQRLFLQTATRSQAGGDAAKMVKRFKQFGKDYFTFVAQPGIDPTNNAAERAIRFCVIDRKVTQGTRGLKGRNWCERIWSTMATCAQRNINAFDFIATAVACYFNDAPAPSLLE